MSLFLGTSMTRTDADGEPVYCDMLIRFRVTSHTPGRAACYYQRNGDPGWPAEPAEFEFEVTGIEFDAGAAMGNLPPDDAPWPITDDEDATLRQWFDANYDLAWDKANDAAAEGAIAADDAKNDQRRDREIDARGDARWDDGENTEYFKDAAE